MDNFFLISTHNYIAIKCLDKSGRFRFPELNTINSFALDPATNIEKGEFDYAITLLQPSIYSEIEAIRGDNSKALKRNYEENQIPKAVLKSRFWEHALIHHMFYSLNDSGKAVITIGKRPLSRHSTFASEDSSTELGILREQ
jgi:hypothetical protein